MTLDTDLIAAWQFDATGRISPGITTEYLRYIRLYAAEVGPLDEATTFTLRRFLIAHSDRWAPATQAIARRALRSFYSWAETNGVCANAAAGLPAIRVTERAVRVATPEIRTALVDACHTARDRALIHLIFGSGARRGEILALRIGDVDATAGTLKIAKSKTGKPRIAPIDRDARLALAAWLTERGTLDTDLLWTCADGRALSDYGAKTRLRKITQRANVQWSSHDARRLAATTWLARGGSQVLLEAALGWAPGSPMAARYTRMSREDLALAEHRRLFG